MEMTYYLAVDIGASSGRHMLSHLEDGKLVLEEIYRFPNGMTNTADHARATQSIFFSHHSGFTRGNMAIDSSMPTNGMMLQTGRAALTASCAA